MADFRRIACKRQAICQCQRGRCHRYLHTEPIYQPRVPQWCLGPLHNKSVKPKIEISDAQIENNSLSFSVYRVEGVDVYGSFLIGISLKNADGDIVLEKKGEELADFPIGNIDNKYIARVAPGKHSLVIPLGSKATLTIDDTAIGSLPKGKYELVLTDISGITWKKEIIH